MRRVIRETHIPAARESERDCAYPINPFFSLACYPNAKQPLNGGEQIGLLRDDEQSRAATASKELGEVPGHCFPVVGYEDSPTSRSHRQCLDVIKSTQAGLPCSLEIHSRLASQNTSYDVLIEISLCLEPNLHGWGACVS